MNELHAQVMKRQRNNKQVEIKKNPKKQKNP